MRDGKKKRLSWQKKVVLSILCAVIAVVTILFGATYAFFVERLKNSDEKIATINFRQAEKNIRELLELAAQEGARYAGSQPAWEFARLDYSVDKRDAEADRETVGKFEEIMDINRNVYSLAQINGNGTVIICSATGKCAAGTAEFSDELKALMEESQEQYPRFLWNSGIDMKIAPGSILSAGVNIPVLSGICAITTGKEAEENSFLMITIREEAVSDCYKTASYNHSTAVLTGEDGSILSSTEQSLIDTQFTESKDCQIVRYPLEYNGWTLINMIPRETYEESTRGFRNFAILILASAALCVTGISVVWSWKYTRPIQILMDRMKAVGNGRFDIPEPEKAGWPELDELNRIFYVTVQNMKIYMEKLKESEQEKAEEELRALQYQINPHFLYNSLNSIRWMAMMTNNTRVADSLVSLSKIIAPIFRNLSFTWKIRDEIEFLDNYIKMMGIRFGEMLDYRMDCPEELEEETIPRFVLQPVLENCFVHGAACGGIRQISVAIQKENNGCFCIEVKNSTQKADSARLEQVTRSLAKMERVQKEEVGLYNAAKRLRLLYGEESGITAEAVSEHEVSVKIRYRKKDGEKGME